MTVLRELAQDIETVAFAVWLAAWVVFAVVGFATSKVRLFE